MTRATPLMLALAAPALAGCTGWADGYAGPAYATTGGTQQDGYSFGAESFFTPKPHTALNMDHKTLPIGMHTGLQLTTAPAVQSFSWLTGLAYFTHPEPVSGYAIIGTNLHFDLLEGHFSFGNYQPYGELGVAARLGQRDNESDGWILTMGGQVLWLINYLANANEPLSQGYVTLKFGLGWDFH